VCVVELAFLVIAENLVGLGDGLEGDLGFCPDVFGDLVRVMLEREL